MKKQTTLTRPVSKKPALMLQHGSVSKRSSCGSQQELLQPFGKGHHRAAAPMGSGHDGGDTAILPGCPSKRALYCGAMAVALMLGVCSWQSRPSLAAEWQRLDMQLQSPPSSASASQHHLLSPSRDGAPGGPLCERPWLLILSTGRAGSTTILEMLEYVPQLHVRGETHMLVDAQKFLRQAEEGTGQQLGQQDGAFQHAAISKESLLLVLQDWFVAMNPPYEGEHIDEDTVWGIKEVGWTFDHIEFYEELFPCAKFIFNMRNNLEDQAKSGYFAKRADKIITKLEQRTKDVHTLHNRLGPERSILLALEEFSVETFNELLDWLEIDGCRYTSLLHANKHGYNADHRDHSILEGDCYFREGAKLMRRERWGSSP